MRPYPRSRHLLAAALAALAVAACASQEAERSTAADAGASSGYAPAPSPDAPVALKAAPPRAPAAAAERSAADAAQPPAAQGAAVAPSMLIRTGSATVEVDSLEQAIQQVTQLAARVGGYVANTAVQTGDDQVRSATLELRIPSARWDDALAGLRPLGELQAVNTATEDVGEEYADIETRVANARRMETRLLELLATRTGKLEDVLAVERELARVREEIERMEGRMRYLRTRVATSTLSVTVHEPAPITAPGRNPIADALRQAWANFVGFVAFFIASLGVLVPLGAVLLAAWWVARRLGLRRPSRRPVAGPLTAPAE